jgi:hypothetical protein
MLSKQGIEKLILYLSGVFFILFIPLYKSNTPVYIANFTVMALMIAYFIRYKIAIPKLSVDFIFGMAVFFIILVTSLFVRPLSYVICIIFVKFILFFWFFNKSELKLSDIIKFVNVIFLIYFLLSLVLYFELIPLPADFEINAFEGDNSLLPFKTLFGAEGSTAHIDAFSSVVFFVNVVLNKNRTRGKYFFIILSLIAFIWTQRLTPLFVILISFLILLLVRNRKFALLILLTMLAGFVYFLYTLYNTDSIEYIVISTIATHNRSMIWMDHLDIMVNNFKPYDYIFGNFNIDMFTVHVTGFTAETYNPHNNYLFFFYNSAVLCVMFLFVLVKKIYVSFNPKYFPVIFMILMAAFSNNSIFWLANPIFTIFLMFMIARPELQKV